MKAPLETGTLDGRGPSPKICAHHTRESGVGMQTTLSKARTTTAVALSLLCGGQWAAGTAHADTGEGHAPQFGLSVVTIDNSGADSWLEVDRTLNMLAPLSKGTAGSDHDGGGGAVEQIVSGSSGVGLQAAPQESGEAGDDEEEGESAACGGDDPEGDADHDSQADAPRHPGSCDQAAGVHESREARR
jgi:hypothetical protein